MLVNAPMERLFRILKSEWVPATGYRNMADAQKSITEYLMGYYSDIRPHQYNGGLTPHASTGLLIKPWPVLLAHQLLGNAA